MVRNIRIMLDPIVYFSVTRLLPINLRIYENFYSYVFQTSSQHLTDRNKEFEDYDHCIG